MAHSLGPANAPLRETMCEGAGQWRRLAEDAERHPQSLDYSPERGKLLITVSKDHRALTVERLGVPTNHANARSRSQTNSGKGRALGTRKLYDQYGSACWNTAGVDGLPQGKQFRAANDGRNESRRPSLAGPRVQIHSPPAASLSQQ